MGILDEAIREHLELKRQHGAGDSELKKIEQEAFGPGDRPGAEAPPDAFAEAPTEFLAQPEVAKGEVSEEREPRARDEGPSIADLQEPPEIEHEPVAEAPEPLPHPEPEPLPQPEPETQSGPHTTEEREAIAEQPTELYEVEEELVDTAPTPSDEEIVEEEMAEPRLAPADPLAGLEESEEAEVSVEGPAPEEEEDDEFWNEQRLSDELDRALESPFEEEEEVQEPQAAATEPEAYEAEEAERREPGESERREDVLDDTPDFLEEAPEDDQLWFEQKPPKDFDFDD
jgi:hypothetical protein